MYEGKTQLTRIWVVKPEFVNNWNEITEAHTKWMAETHYKDGNKKLHFLNWSTAPEIKDDKETGNTMFVLTEVYETSVGVDDHAQQAKETLSLPHSTKDGVVSLTICDYGAIKHSLWKD